MGRKRHGRGVVGNNPDNSFRVCCSVLICYPHTRERRRRRSSFGRVWKRLSGVLCVCVCALRGISSGCCCCCWLEGSTPVGKALERERETGGRHRCTSFIRSSRRCVRDLTSERLSFCFLFLFLPLHWKKTWCSTCLKRWPARTKPPITAPKITTSPGNKTKKNKRIEKGKKQIFIRLKNLIFCRGVFHDVSYLSFSLPSHNKKTTKERDGYRVCRTHTHIR